MRAAWWFPRLRKYRHLEIETRRNRKGFHAPDVFQRLRRRQSFQSGDLHRWPLHGLPGCQDRRPRRRRLWHLAPSLQAITARAKPLSLDARAKSAPVISNSARRLGEKSLSLLHPSIFISRRRTTYPVEVYASEYSRRHGRG